MGEVEGVEALVWWQAGISQVAFDTASGAFGDLEFGKGAEEACGGPSLAVGPLGHLGPQTADGGQAQFAKQQRQPCGVHLDTERCGAAHG